MTIDKKIGLMIKGQGFFYSSAHKKDPADQWASDEFSVEHTRDDNKLKFIITFTTIFGEVTIHDWSIQSLPLLSKREGGMSILVQQLCALNIRCCPSQAATIAIINAIQNPNLVSRL